MEAVRKVLKVLTVVRETVAKANTFLLVALLFAFVFTPAGVLLRLLRRDTLSRGAAAGWTARAGGEELGRQF